jgi:phenol 2-monooxygenase
MDEEGIDMAGFKDAFVKGNMFASGIAVDYGVSMIVAKSGDAGEQGDGTDVSVKGGGGVVSRQELASEVKVGMRMPSFKVLNQADARPWHFQELLRSNGRWRVVVFAGDVLDKGQKARIDELGKKLSEKGSFLKKYTPSGGKYDSVIEVLTVHSSPRQEVTIFDFAEVFRPWDERDGWDYWKIFVDDQSYHEGHGEAYKNYGVDPKKGCAVILRPDQYVSWVGEADDYESMERFFGGFMLEQKSGEENGEKNVPVRVTNGCGANGEAAAGVKAGDEAVAGMGGQ